VQPRVTTLHRQSCCYRPVRFFRSTANSASLYNFPRDANGAGQTIAIVQFGGGFIQADLDAYFASLGLRSPKVTAISVDKAINSPGSDADREVMLDIEVAGAVANGANIAVYFAPNSEKGFVDAVLDAIHNPQQTPSVVSISWGGAEDKMSQQFVTALNSVLHDAATLGITVVAASGDDGSRDGVADKQLHVDFPASSPYVLACGGTTLMSTANAIASESVWHNPGGGATGGGVSTVFERPAYQDSANIPSHPRTGFSGRGVPDVAGNADSGTGYRIHLNGADEIIGGTSAVAPLWAGLIAVLNQKLGQQLGFVNEKLYSMGPQSFRIIASGSNDNAGLGAHYAHPGWNACTGLGSPDASQILASLTTSGGGAPRPAGRPRRPLHRYWPSRRQLIFWRRRRRPDRQYISCGLDYCRYDIRRDRHQRRN
jgi:kumamolisin